MRRTASALSASASGLHATEIPAMETAMAGVEGSSEGSSSAPAVSIRASGRRVARSAVARSAVARAVAVCSSDSPLPLVPGDLTITSEGSGPATSNQGTLGNSHVNFPACSPAVNRAGNAELDRIQRAGCSEPDLASRMQRGHAHRLIDRHGPRLAHFNGVLQLFSQLGAPIPSETGPSGADGAGS